MHLDVVSHDTLAFTVCEPAVTSTIQLLSVAQDTFMAEQESAVAQVTLTSLLLSPPLENICAFSQAPFALQISVSIPSGPFVTISMFLHALFPSHVRLEIREPE
jgi:hypothetical protein